jgi:hypothetical protein
MIKSLKSGSRSCMKIKIGYRIGFQVEVDFGEDGILINKDHESIPLITTISDRGPQNLKRKC